MSSQFFDLEVFTDRAAAQIRAASYQMEPNARTNVRIVETDRVLLHESKGTPPATLRKYDSMPGTYFIVISEA